MAEWNTDSVTDLVASAMALASAQGPLRLVELSGEADMTSRQLKDVLDAEVAGRPPLLVVDLSGLTFMDSWALHTILAAARELGAAGGALALASPSQAIRRVLELSGADTLIDVYASVLEASEHKPR
jgi:anti-anti-sigma factor